MIDDKDKEEDFDNMDIFESIHELFRRRRKNDMKAKQILGFFGGGTAPYVYSDEYLAWLAAPNGGTPPTTDLNKQAEDIFIRSWVYEGAWTLADQILLLSTRGDENFSLVNIKSPGTRNASKVSTPTFSTGSGWGSVGSLTAYLRTNFIPSTHGSNLTQNNAGILFYTPTNEATSATKVEFGGNQAALLNAIVCSIFASSAANIRINGSTNFASAVASSDGFYQFKRNSSAELQIFRNGVLVGTSGANNSSGLTTVELYILVHNNNGSAAGGTTKVAGFWAIGANFVDAVQPLRMEFNLATYYDVLQVTQELITPPSFSDWKDFDAAVSGYISSIAALSATYSGTPSLHQMFLKGASLVGSNKWQGGALAENDCIYCAPSTAQSVLKINTLTDLYTTFGTVTATLAKYGGAVYSSNGKVYFCPQNANSVMVIDTLNSDAISYFDQVGVQSDADDGALNGAAQWYGIYQGADGRLYCVPFNATEVMIIDPSDDSITFIDTTGVVAFGAGNLGAGGKWDGGCVYGDYIYCSPSDATDFLKINTLTGTCTRFETVPAGTSKWAISTVGPNDFIYIFPYFDNRVIKLNPADDTFSYLATTIGSIDSTIKVGAATLMPDGRILVTPCEQTQSRMLNTSTDALTTIGRSLSGVTNLRWIGGAIAANGASYAVPFTGQFIIKQFYGGKRTTLPDNFIYNRNGRYS